MEYMYNSRLKQHRGMTEKNRHNEGNQTVHSDALDDHIKHTTTKDEFIKENSTP